LFALTLAVEQSSSWATSAPARLTRRRARSTDRRSSVLLHDVARTECDAGWSARDEMHVTPSRSVSRVVVATNITVLDEAPSKKSLARSQIMSL
jgi:hypothetical protein